MSPDQMLANTEHLYAEIEKAKKMHVAVGLPVEKVGGKIYGDGMSIFQIGAIHEFGAVIAHPKTGSITIPMRSFLRTPFAMKKKEIDEALAKGFQGVADGKKVAAQALGIVGIIAENISKGAFTTQGYGTWPDIKAATKKRKGSSQPLIDTGTLRGSITSIVREN